MSTTQLAEAAFKNLLSNFTVFKTDNSLEDTIFRVGNEGNTTDFNGISHLFAIASPVFKSQLFGRLQESQKTTGIITDNSPEVSSMDNLIPRTKKYGINQMKWIQKLPFEITAA